MSKQRAVTKQGEILDGIQCFVLESGTRVVSTSSLSTRLLTGGESTVAGFALLSRRLERLPNGSALLPGLPVCEFLTIDGRVAKGLPAASIVDILELYAAALRAGTLHSQQMPVAMRAIQMISALARTGIVALVDEATEYEKQREAAGLSYIFSQMLLKEKAGWARMWSVDFVAAILRLEGIRYTGGPQPLQLQSTYYKIYRLVLGEDTYAELKKRNPKPEFGSNHHQWLTPDARERMRSQIPSLTMIANICASKAEFWEKLESLYHGRPLQLGLPRTA